MPAVSDTSAVTESLGLLETAFINVSDTSAVTDSTANSGIYKFLINLSESSTVTDSKTVTKRPFLAHNNFAYSTVLTAPSPASSGTSLTVQNGLGAIFPAPPFSATVWPNSAQPFTTSAELVLVTAISGDTFTIVRAQEGSSARSILVGDQIAATETVKTFTDIENYLQTTEETLTGLRQFNNGVGTSVNTATAGQIAIDLTLPNIQSFTTAGTATWSKPSGAQHVIVYAWGGGGGGGSGRHGANSTNTNGGGGGSGGSLVIGYFSASELGGVGGTETVTVGAGGLSAGNGIGTGSTDGNAGPNGGSSSFGSWLTAAGGTGGTGGTNSNDGTNGAAGNTTSHIFGWTMGSITGGTGAGGAGQYSTAGANGTQGILAGGGGGGGGGIDSSNNVRAGGNGGAAVQQGGVVTTGPTGGAANAGVTATAGTNGTTYSPGTGGAGSGGGSTTSSASGGAGGIPGGGGGGGGGARNSQIQTGSGGNGGRGQVIVVSY